MYVVATAGHVDHGKSALVRALTGIEPDRWAEERRRGLTIDLGFAWTSLPSGASCAFVDVPGHERFIGNMLAGIGPAPAVLLVVAADEGWMPQSQEHLDVIAALSGRHVLPVITKCDLAPPEPVADVVVERLAEVGIESPASIAVSAATGQGLVELRAALDVMLADLPPPDRAAPVRFWIDRAFSVRGAGTVVTGTLTAGQLHVGDTLQLHPTNASVTIRGLQMHNAAVAEALPTARVAINLRGIDRADVQRGCTLITPQRWQVAAEIDVIGDVTGLPADVVVHAGTSAVPARIRRLGDVAARLRLATASPWHVGDRLLLRDPVSRRIVGADVADLQPQPLRRRGDAGRIAAQLRVPTSPDDLVEQRGICSQAELTAAGFTTQPGRAVLVGEYAIATERWQQLHDEVQRAVATVGELSAGVPLHALARQLNLADDAIVATLVHGMPSLRCVDGRVAPAVTEPIQLEGLARLLERLSAEPFAAPDSDELAALGLTADVLAAATRRGQLTRLAPGIFVAVDAVALAADRLAELPQPFSVSAARDALNSTRRVVVPLLEQLDAQRRTQRLPDGRRRLVSVSTAASR